jgi:hypothetical protein
MNLTESSSPVPFENKDMYAYRNSTFNDLLNKKVDLNIGQIIIIVMWVILLTLTTIFIYLNRYHIKVVFSRCVSSTCLLNMWVYVRGNQEQTEQTQAKVNYEIYNPNTGGIEDRQYCKYPNRLAEELKREIEMMEQQNNNKKLRNFNIQGENEPKEDILKESPFFNDIYETEEN